MKKERWPKKMLEWVPAHNRKRGRPRKTWSDEVEEVMKERNLDQGDWTNRKRWRLGCEKRF